VPIKRDMGSRNLVFSEMGPGIKMIQRLILQEHTEQINPASPLKSVPNNENMVVLMEQVVIKIA